MTILVTMYANGMRMSAGHSRYSNVDSLVDNLRSDEYELEFIEQLLKGECMECEDGESWMYLINE